VTNAESEAGTRALQLLMPFSGGPTFDAAEPRSIEGLILYRCGAIFHGKQATQSKPEAGRHVADANAQVLAPATQISRMTMRRHP
jgi:hypothetical protein